jgi:chromate transporter
MAKHSSFLWNVLLYACTAFGGPNAHLGIMSKLFVQKRKDISQEELMDIFSFCQLLPGPSSTQTITLIAYKKGGILLAVLTLLIWILPAVCIMSAFSFLYVYKHFLPIKIFNYLPALAIGFLLFAIVQFFSFIAKSKAVYGIIISCAIISLASSLYFATPWLFPILLLLASLVTNLSSKRIPKLVNNPARIKWSNLYLFIIIFAIAAITSEMARVQQWPQARLFNLFENFYRFGSIVWGGGHALIGAIDNQFIQLPKYRDMEPLLTQQENLIGFGFVACVPGPVFSVCSYIGGITCRSMGVGGQLAGSFAATLGVFLPSLLLVLFLYPVYNKLKQHVIIYRALEGIHAAIIGVLISTAISMSMHILPNKVSIIGTINILVILACFLLLKYSKVPQYLIVFACLVLGYLL